MRSLMTVVIGGLLVLSAGCTARDPDDPTVASAVNGSAAPSAAPSASFDPDAPLKYAKCMREQGMAWFPDPPAPGQAQSLNIPQGLPDGAFEAAEEACRQWAPNSSEKGAGPTAEDIEKLRAVSQCMRENGVPEFPDPKADGSMMLDEDTLKKLSSKPGEAIFDAAEKKCEELGPKGGPKQRVDGNGGVSGGGTA
ncbi:hypothetical protein GCM10010112_32120 [Actinoplanes lobatus]|uniref:Lipoprotein n=1 Tax=Actinoplanes lobatus TaxID=113568 RepID=A0A7W7HE79_9ACTN|nr:hypothetical protein [Actinoplanes lobatus]MBB4748926.1 hypothetical protein [Actinoplanes lobatus]GGN68099.1 hypothetical protein GCM10010112_32120 [Actinoplanes lobatus]GIE37166.1 hypothetical protein Alo02nite_00640 [Actinoplanes lobatus]